MSYGTHIIDEVPAAVSWIAGSGRSVGESGGEEDGGEDDELHGAEVGEVGMLLSLGGRLLLLMIGIIDAS